MDAIKRKLLNKTLRVYVLFSVIVLVISAPLFYLLIQRLYEADADEALLLAKEEFIKYTLPEMNVTDIAVWNKVNRDIKIEQPLIVLKKDTLYDAWYFDLLANEKEPYRELKSPVIIQGTPYNLIVRINLLESEDLIQNIALLFILMVGLLLLGFFIITRQLSGRLWKSFYETLKQIEHFEIDKSSLPQLTETSVEEFERLNTAINKLISRNIAIYKSQQEFIENAAHELQTPLAVFQAQIDTLMQDAQLTGAQAEIVTKLNDSATRLSHVNRNLLLLSKIDNDQFALKTKVYVNGIVAKQLDFFTEQAKQKNVSIEVITEQELVVEANETLTEIIISNLFLNAVRHNIQNGTITITINKNTFAIANTGLEEPLNSKKLFQRFSKINPAGKGSGLGLAISQKIALSYHWQLEYYYQNNRHYFTIGF